ncbi:MAG TPA: protein kinase, partial [Gemmataceae bacterium]|nr:protein kinase [Gemmataceae bacterium]
MITFSCKKCGKQYHVKPDFAGRKTTCSGCKAPLVVPTPEATPAPSAKIAFACDKCGTKFNVPGASAGHKTTCPACKNALTVPTADATVAYVPANGKIKGTHSSLAQAGMDGGVTLAGDFATAEALSMQNLIDGKANDGARYIVESELARGGMGAVMRAVDCDIRREVAVKYLLDQSDVKKKQRFVEEAQITGQLEHPNIVPIHELGIDSEKRMFFSMKMVKGRSVADILKGLRDKPAEMGQEFTQGRLLSIFIGICNALAYAHARGVVHRDLKPANVMVGDFGEVYVMDWGLAKVQVKAAVATTAAGPVMAIPVAKVAEPFDFRAPPPLATPASETSQGSSGKVVTSREEGADLTQQGAVIGTPVYMPPEQASGKLDQIDERSDIYSMGAILYEMLALQPPISKEGGFWPILARVAMGEIVPPEKKAPERARIGKIPPELSAIAMKALAKAKDDRYQTVDALKRDIELFIEGRSVSAKQDNMRDMAVKFVKRNKGVSIATAAAAGVLFIVGVWSLVAILRANGRTQQAYDAYVAEQNEKRAQAKKSVPALVRAARLTIAEKQFDDAVAQLNAAIGFDDTEPEARLLRAQLLIANQEYAAARVDLEACLKQQPKREEAKSLLELVRDARKDDRVTLVTFAEEFSRQKVPPLAERMTKSAEKLMASKNDLLQLYQVRIEAAWPGQRAGMTLDHADHFAMSFGETFVVNDLEALRGMALTTLAVPSSQNIPDLGPLKGMPLVGVSFYNGSQVADLEPLRGMRLTTLAIQGFYKVRDYSALKGMPITSLNVSFCGISDLSPFADMK